MYSTVSQYEISRLESENSTLREKLRKEMEINKLRLLEIDRLTATVGMTKARQIAEEAVLLLRRKNMNAKDIEVSVQKIEAMIEAALAGDEQSPPNPEPPEPEPPTIWPE